MISLALALLLACSAAAFAPGLAPPSVRLTVLASSTGRDVRASTGAAVKQVCGSFAPQQKRWLWRDFSSRTPPTPPARSVSLHRADCARIGARAQAAGAGTDG